MRVAELKLNMDRDQCREYFSYAKDLEERAYEAHQLMEEFIDQRDVLDMKVDDIEEEIAAKEKRTEYENSGTLWDKAKKIAGTLLLGLVLGAAAGLVIAVVCNIFLFITIFFSDHHLNIGITMLVMSAVGMVAVPIFYREEIAESCLSKKKREKNIKYLETYRSLAQEKEAKLKKKSELCGKQAERVGLEFLAMHDVKEEFYDVLGLPAKYRGLAEACTLYEYFDSGRCDCLEGRRGALALFDGEAKLGRVITAMDEIKDKVDTLAENQMVLAESMRGCAARVASLSKGVQDSAAEARRARFYSESAAQRSNSMLWLKAIEVSE